MKKEIWKSIPGYSSYEASTIGRIRSIDKLIINNKSTRFFSGKLRKLGKGAGGYFIILISNNAKKQITQNVHSLVALTFLGPRPPGLEVAHLNGKKTDNRLSNLKYCTRTENHSHKRLHGTALYGEKNHRSKFKTKDVLNIRKLAKLGFSDKEIAKKYKMDRRHVCSIRN